MIPARNYYKPLQFPWAEELWQKHESMHWMHTEVPMHEDVKDWEQKLTTGEKDLVSGILRFFTQGDIDVAAGYNRKFLPYFGGTPELAMMMSSFSAREAVHVAAYALLLETVGMPETTYQDFQNYKEMKDKHDFVEKFGMEKDYDVLRALAVYSAFTEGMQLFGSFVVLLNFSRFGKMKAMGNIVSWSIRDENLHVDGMTRLFKECKKTWTRLGRPGYHFFCEGLEEEIRPLAHKMVELEDAFMDLIFKDAGNIEGLTVDEVKAYIRHIANGRWAQLGFEGKLFPEVENNPLPWVDYMVNGVEHANFFEKKATEYSKAMTKGDMTEVEW